MSTTVPQLFTRIIYSYSPDGLLQLHFVYEPPASEFATAPTEVVAAVVLHVSQLADLIARLTAYQREYQQPSTGRTP